LATTAVLSRLLQPSDFGLISMALVVTRLPLMINDLGTASGVIQHESPSMDMLSSVFWMNIIFAVISTVLIFAGAPFVSQFYGESSLTPALRALSLVLLFSGPRSLLQALLEREYRFADIARAELVGAAAGTAAALFLALKGKGVWSLVALNVVGPAIASVLIWTASQWRPCMVFKWSALRGLARYSGSLTAFNILNFLSRNADNVIIGRVLGAQALGYYSLAYTLMLYPLKSVSGVIGRGVLPTFARLQHDHVSFKREFLEIAGLTAALTFPMMFALGAMCEPFTIGVFGEQWRPAVVLILILTPVGMIQSILTFNGTIYQAIGRTDRQLLVEVIFTPLVIASFVFGLRWGIAGVAGAYMAMSLALALPSAMAAYGLIGLSSREMVKTLTRPLGAGMTVALALLCFQAVLPRSVVPMMVVILAVPVGLGVYLLTARRLLAPELERFQGLIRLSPP